jgi:hypothetical protein
MISKRAWELSDLWEQISSIWHTNEGFCENLFRILSYLIPFVPGLGWGIFILEKIAAFFDMGLASLGAAIDRFLGWAPSETLNISQESFYDGIKDFFGNILKPKAAASEEEMVKLAWLGGLLAMVRAIPRVLTLLWTAVKFLLLAFGFSKVGEIYSAVTGTTEPPGAAMLRERTEEEKETSGLSEEQAQSLMGLVTDPSKLVQPITKMIPNI